MRYVMLFARIAQPIGNFWRYLLQHRESKPRNIQPDFLQLQALRKMDLVSWAPTHRHRKGGLYRVLGNGILEANGSLMIIYDDAEGTTWIRSATEFDDGRFKPC